MAGRLSRLLRFLIEQAVQNPATPPKESVIGTEVFDRDPAYDPKTDPVVRSEIRRLRFKLAEYYLESGQNDPILIEIPKGGYAARFTARVVPRRTFSSLWIRSAAAVSVTILAVAVFAYRAWPRGEASGPRWVAVIPFQDLSRDGANGPLAEALTEEVKTELGQVSGLRVIARIAPGEHQDLAALVGRLKLAAIIEGQLRTIDGGRARIEAHVTKAGENSYAWSRIYDIELSKTSETDVLERDVARAAALALGLRPSLDTAGIAASDENPQAREYYLRGKFFFRQRFGPQFDSSGKLFEDAIHIDPGYAPAYAGLADYYAFRVANHIDKASDDLVLGMAAARKAIALRPNLADAHAALGLLLFSNWKFQAAAREYETTLRLNPNLATVHNRIALVDFAQNRFPEAERELRKAQSLDPINLGHSSTLVELYYYWRRFPDGIRVCHEMLATDPGNYYARVLLAKIAWAQGRKAEAVAIARSLGRAASDDPILSAFLLAADLPPDARKDPGLWHRQFGNLIAPASTQAEFFISLGNREESLRLLRQAVRDQDTELMSLRWEPLFEPLMGDPRFQSILASLPAE